MKTLKITGAVVLLSVLTMSFYSFETTNKNNQTTHISADSVLRHVVLFKFKDGTAPEDIKKVEDAFSSLPSKIPQIKGYEWGVNNSPESLNKGLTHCFFLTFESEEDRGIYLPHPNHKAFGEVLGPHLDDVLVLDYWTK
ncbi:stress responsive alpha-beta barrel domain-containing protein [Maribacter sp. 4U21]|uniref:Dabb family protein n=1 Tax=Maribacter sp. 4U21 TaxID=1889779 RepID=UPI000C151D7A|nr:Dabb family protein [Maribacter sp. 4U21]PIB28104.1 stress responsive alpha-beta barrel domain-containing protein [Maribacter sp. 4U21]